MKSYCKGHGDGIPSRQRPGPVSSSAPPHLSVFVLSRQLVTPVTSLDTPGSAQVFERIDSTRAPRGTRQLDEGMEGGPCTDP